MISKKTNFYFQSEGKEKERGEKIITRPRTDINKVYMNGEIFHFWLVLDFQV